MMHPRPFHVGPFGRPSRDLEGPFVTRLPHCAIISSVPSSVDEWSDQHWDRSYSRQSSQADTVKLVTTFALAVAATLVATALQVSPQGLIDLWSSICLGLSFLGVIAVIIFDRLQWPSRSKVLQHQADHGLSDTQLLNYLTMLSRDLEESNENVINRMKRLAEYQILLAAAAATLAVVSLFQPTA